MNPPELPAAPEPLNMLFNISFIYMHLLTLINLSEHQLRAFKQLTAQVSQFSITSPPAADISY